MRKSTKTRTLAARAHRVRVDLNPATFWQAMIARQAKIDNAYALADKAQAAIIRQRDKKLA